MDQNGSLKSDFLKIPNILSMFRLFLVPLFIISFMNGSKNVPLSFGLLLLSLITDVLDGYFARKLGQVTELGKILDPLADKITQVAVVFALWLKGFVPFFLFLVVAAKEATMVIGAIYLNQKIKSAMIPSNGWGKSATATFYASVVLFIIDAPFGLGVYVINISVVLAMVAFMTYMQTFINMKNRV
ncbi:MAG: CDP-alcohol phosphatidyltransferase family protein [Eubacteriaceae bacterium]|nr:CDP-alcohol phosphatidyltransferase family protein [Eubacteriaceae bacterium]